jgi:hypothetical protein
MQMKPIAIVLAEELDTHISSSTALAAADELRKLYKQNISLIEILSAQNDLIKEFVNPKNSSELNNALRQAIESIDMLMKPKVMIEPYDAKNKTKRFYEPA